MASESQADFFSQGLGLSELGLWPLKARPIFSAKVWALLSWDCDLQKLGQFIQPRSGPF